MTTGQPSAKLLYLDILAAAMLLTRIPVHWPEHETPETDRSYWAFPVIGVGVAAMAAIPAGLLVHYGMPGLAAALLALAGVAVVTGGLHQDGLADVADGLGGRDPQSRLQIMRDSSVGSYGILALIFTTGISAACLAAIAAQGGMALLHAMITTAALSRAMMAVQRHVNATPDETGLASMTGRPSATVAISAVLLGSIIAISFSGIGAAFMLVGAGLAVTWLLGRFLHSLFGGVNGDGLGATQQLSETVMLVILAMAAA